MVMISLTVKDRARWRCFAPLASNCRFQTGKNALQKSSTSQNNSSKLSIEGLLGIGFCCGDKSLLPFETLSLSRIHVELKKGRLTAWLRLICLFNTYSA